VSRAIISTALCEAIVSVASGLSTRRGAAVSKSLINRAHPSPWHRSARCDEHMALWAYLGREERHQARHIVSLLRAAPGGQAERRHVMQGEEGAISAQDSHSAGKSGSISMQCISRSLIHI
jgi:hypothetical protein